MFNLSRRGRDLRGLKGGFLLLAALALFASTRGREFAAPAVTATLAAFRSAAPPPAPPTREVGPGPQTMTYLQNTA